jgi:hypothetical protein|tara:strand:- start:10 stop:237 length:228 start_codon:yes stop_codon:yes gene_type:complete
VSGKRRKGFLTHGEAIKLVGGMTPEERRHSLILLNNARYNIEKGKNFDIDPKTGQKRFRFNKGGIVSRVKQTKYF